MSVYLPLASTTMCIYLKYCVKLKDNTRVTFPCKQFLSMLKEFREGLGKLLLNRFVISYQQET